MEGTAGTVGLANLGNTCYMNATLQALYACTEFLVQVHEVYMNLSPPLHTVLADLFYDISEQARTNNFRAIRGEQFLTAFLELTEPVKGEHPFKRGVQHDAQEFLGQLFVLLRRELDLPDYYPNPRPNQDPGETQRSYIEDMFGVVTDSLTGCDLCGNQSTGHDFNNCLFVKFPKKSKSFYSLRELIDRISEPERQEEANCFNVNCQMPGISRIDTIANAPEILVVVIGRYGHDFKTRRDYRIGDTVQLNEWLTICGQPYRLFAIVDHLGETLHGGHYIAHCRHGEKWITCDDEWVEPIEWFQSRNHRDPFRSNRAYMTYYTRMATPAQPQADPSATQSRTPYVTESGPPVRLTGEFNTTGIRAAIQALYACDEFRQIVFASGSYQKAGDLMCELAVLFSVILGNEAVAGEGNGEHSLDIKMIDKVFADVYKEAIVDSELDFVGLLQFLGPRLSSELRHSGVEGLSATEPLNDLFGGMFGLTTRCENGHQSWANEPYVMMEVNISELFPGQTEFRLQSLINYNYNSPDCAMDVDCGDPNCGSRAWKSWSVVTTPPILVMYLTRWYFDPLTNDYRRNDKLVIMEPTVTVKGERFELFAVINQVYVEDCFNFFCAYVRRGDTWWSCMDKYITRLSTASGADPELPFSPAFAYVMFYRKL